MLFVIIEPMSELWNESEDEITMDIEPELPSIQPQVLSAEERKIQILKVWIIGFLTHLRRVYSISDAVTSLLLKFMSILFGILGQIFPPCSLLAELPSLYRMRHILGELKEFKRYVVCRKCHSVYELDQCKNTNNTSRKCQYVPYPNHPHERMRKSCDTLLLKTVELASSKKIMYPYRIYCYLSIENSLQSLLLTVIVRNGEEEK